MSIRAIAITVSDNKFFPGTLAAINSFLYFHSEDSEITFDIAVISSGLFNIPLSAPQISLLTAKGVKVYPHSHFEREGRVLGAWQLKAYSPCDLCEGYDMVIGFDSDLVFCSNISDVIHASLLDGRWRGGADGSGVLYDASYSNYGISPNADRAPYMSTSCYFCPTTESNLEVLRKWAICTDEATYGPQAVKRFPGHGDQGVLNACIYAENQSKNVTLLENDIWSQHWVYEDHVVEWKDDCLWNYSTNRKMRTLHCGGSSKFWQKEHSEKRSADGGSQRWSYAFWLAMLFIGDLSRWDEDPALCVPNEHSHLYRDFVAYHQLMVVMFPDFRERINSLGWEWIQRAIISVGQPRAMTLNGKSSMDQYIKLVKELPDRATILESGSYLGGSIATLAIALMGRNHTFISAESFTGNLDNTVDGGPLPHLQTYSEYIFWTWGFLNIKAIQLPGQYAATLFEDASIDFVFIDGDHSTEAVIRDINVWLPKVKKGGILAGDDIGWISVKDAVAKCFSDFHELQDIWWVYK